MTSTARTTATAPSTATRRVRMDSTRRTALIAGIFYLLTFAASIPALVLLSPVLNHPDYIVSAGSDTRVLWGCVLDVVTALTGIGSAVALYPVVKKQNHAVALGFVTSRMFEAAVILIGVVSLLAVVTLRQDVAGTPGTDPATLTTVGQALVAVRDWTFLLGPNLMAAVNALLLGSLMYRSRLVPRIIPAMGLIGAPFWLAVTGMSFFGLAEHGLFGIAVLPVAAWEFSVGVWMVVKGFRPSPITAAAVPSEAGRSLVPVA
ncbi:DUF4386 domain-containing protein [Jatrophihabitans sp.]|uniref:DUF4386 domain-containing protein n=1 Tax=Jatrophihabitans sp. TaxID=1932789 RepID=UPI002EDFAE02